VTDDELREYTEEWRDFGYLFIRARWTIDGARTSPGRRSGFVIALRPSGGSLVSDSSRTSRR
jgi:hypothetical protein